LHRAVLHAAPNLQGLMLALPPSPPAPAPAPLPPPPAVASAPSFCASASAAVVFCAGCAYLHEEARQAAPNLHIFKAPSARAACAGGGAAVLRGISATAPRTCAATLVLDPAPPAPCEACGGRGARAPLDAAVAGAAGASSAGWTNGQPVPRARQKPPNLHALPDFPPASGCLSSGCGRVEGEAEGTGASRLLSWILPASPPPRACAPWPRPRPPTVATCGAGFGGGGARRGLAGVV
jgi:hypothetical protein